MVIVSLFYYGKTEVYGKSLLAIEKEISVLRCHKVMKRAVSLNTLAHCVKSVQLQSFFCSVFPRIRTEYREVRNISPYSVWMRENTDQEKLRILTFFKQKLNMVCAMLWSTPDMILRNQSMLNNSFLYFFYTFL